MNKKDFKRGLKMGTSIAIGYAPIAMTFGMMGKSTGVSIFQAFSFSAFVYAGSSQFMALNLLHLGTGIYGIIIATFLLNFRHFLMSASLSARMKKYSPKWIPLLATCVTDEIFSISAVQGNNVSKEFLFGAQIMAYSSWSLNTLIGYLLGEIIPKTLSESMVIGLYAMFIAILVPHIRKSWKVGVIALSGGVANTLIKHFGILPSGWNIVAAILIASTIGVFISPSGEINNKKKDKYNIDNEEDRDEK